jgi:hypothetical protein
LHGEFARRFKDQRARHAGAGPAFFQKRQHGQNESGSFAGARLGKTQHIAPGQGMGNGLGLNGRGRGVTSGGYGLENFGAQPQVRKLHVGGNTSATKKTGNWTQKASPKRLCT